MIGRHLGIRQASASPAHRVGSGNERRAFVLCLSDPGKQQCGGQNNRECRPSHGSRHRCRSSSTKGINSLRQLGQILGPSLQMSSLIYRPTQARTLERFPIPVQAGGGPLLTSAGTGGSSVLHFTYSYQSVRVRLHRPGAHQRVHEAKHAVGHSLSRQS